MPRFPSLQPDSPLMDVFKAHPETALPIIAYHEVVMEGPSPLSLAERELIAAYVSGLNACGYCHGVHTQVAQQHGVAEGVLAALLTDVDTAPVQERLKPLLHYVATLTLSPAHVTDEAAAAVFAAGWDEDALHSAIMVCALFNFMNRMVEGHGITADPSYFPMSGRRIKEGGYTGLIGVIAG